ncbi:MAG: amino acid permease, partial [Syntrophorhabdales bacterium]
MSRRYIRLVVPEDNEGERVRPDGAPRSTFTVPDGVAVIVTMVIGAGIFKTPSLVAARCPNASAVLLLWLAGGAISLAGALCYAELTSAYPHPGGDYHYLWRAFGDIPAFLFAWSRMTVIRTGLIAMHGFLIGDYASQIATLGPYSSSVYGAAAVVLLTAISIAGLKQGKWTQNVLTAAIVLGVASVVGLCLTLPTGRPHMVVTAPGIGHAGVGMALIF